MFIKKMKIYLLINHKMDIITIALIEKHIDIPFDVVLFLNEFIKYDKITNFTIHKAIQLWYDDKQLCLFQYGHISFWDVSNVTDMYRLFFIKKAFNDDISRWNVSNVKSMCGMFSYIEYFDSDISKWNVSKVQNMNSMFCCATLSNIDISEWNVSNVEDMNCMFCHTKIYNTNTLQNSNTLPNVQNIDKMTYNTTPFDCDISKWNVSKVRYVYFMFSHTLITERHIKNWNMSKKLKEYMCLH